MIDGDEHRAGTGVTEYSRRANRRSILALRLRRILR